MTEDISVIIAKVDRKFRDDIERALREVGHPIPRRLIDIASNDQLAQMEHTTAEMRSRILGGQS